VFDVPGAFELPLAAQYLADSRPLRRRRPASRAVIRVETDHYDFVCAEAARGIQDVQLRTGVPCAFGVLTVESMEQALAARAAGKRDQGEHAAETVFADGRAARRAGLAGRQGGRWSAHGRAASSCGGEREQRRLVVRAGRPAGRPSGRPSAVKPAGTEAAAGPWSSTGR
jgi:6,7-dimethyl-8-ribityllumazine synthase